MALRRSTAAEGLEDPRTELCPLVKYFAERKKIFNVHFRNIRGTPAHFQECFLDEGDMDMYEAMQVYREVGFAGPFMLDHIPGIPHQNTHWAARGFAIGYIRAILQAVYR